MKNTAFVDPWNITCTGLDFEKTYRNLNLKGQMKVMLQWNVIMFLGSPNVNSLDGLASLGMFF